MLHLRRVAQAAQLTITAGLLHGDVRHERHAVVRPRSLTTNFAQRLPYFRKLPRDLQLQLNSISKCVLQ